MFPVLQIQHINLFLFLQFPPIGVSFPYNSNVSVSLFLKCSNRGVFVFPLQVLSRDMGAFVFIAAAGYAATQTPSNSRLFWLHHQKPKSRARE